MKEVKRTLVLLAATAAAFAQTCANLGGAAYVQNFDSLESVGTANTALPTGWFLREVGTSTKQLSLLGG